ncbi:MAG: toll/interleukin-1 receptor domain-containing protein [Bryobacteraceae bacterium]
MSSEPDETFDVFLSHAHTEAEAVESIAVRLQDTFRLRVWLDRWILIPGQHWQQELARGLDQAKTCAVCVGSNTPSGWFREEIERALNRQTRDKAFRVIPVILPEGHRGSIDDFLELRTWVDFRKGLEDEDRHCYRVSRSSWCGNRLFHCRQTLFGSGYALLATFVPTARLAR